MKAFKTFQFTWVLLFTLVPVSVFIYLAYKFQIGDRPLPLIPMIGIEVLFAVIFLLFYGLKTSITDKFIVLKYGVGLIKIKISLSNVKDTRIVRNPWYYGFGIKIIPHGMLYSAHGLNAVELTLKNKHRIIRIGSMNNKKLKDEIDKRLKH